MFAIKFREFEPLTYNGERYRPLNMAKEVAANAELLTIIPSNIVKNAAFPLELDDLYKLYATNETITSDDEGALEFDIPSPAEFAF